MECLDDALAIGRGYGVRLHYFFQSVGQLKRCFPEGQEQTLLSNTTQIFFGVNDYPTAETVSQRLGKATILVDGWGTSDGHTSQNGGSHGAGSVGAPQLRRERSESCGFPAVRCE